MEGVKFTDDPLQVTVASHHGRVIHIMCLHGKMSFQIAENLFHITASNYAIIVPGQIITDLEISEDWDGIIMLLDDTFVRTIPIRNNYGMIGFVSLVSNPIIKLSPSDALNCEIDLQRLRIRIDETSHLFHDELVASLLKAHILDLYDIHARISSPEDISERQATLMRRFMEMLLRGDYRSYRAQKYYADALCITPHYLSEVCKTVSGQPFSFWIDRFAIQEAVHLLNDPTRTITEISELLNFSSTSYFTRYIQKHLGVAPTTLRHQDYVMN